MPDWLQAVGMFDVCAAYILIQVVRCAAFFLCWLRLSCCCALCFAGAFLEKECSGCHLCLFRFWEG